ECFYCMCVFVCVCVCYILITVNRNKSEVDVDAGRDLDIFEINAEAGLDLVEGDIMQDETEDRNSIVGEQFRWPHTIPYTLEDSLEINAKGVVLKAFEQYRLKTCIDFKPWSGEDNYISVFKGSGCFSSVGNRHVGQQTLSIGSNCDRLATVEHEFLHALGFWHEQSRSDRDDYVGIVWDQIQTGKEHNFNLYDDGVSSSLGVPYDYGSMMHYSKTAFRKGEEPTIVTKIPEFMDVIGQRMEFSDSDLLKLNRLYNCTSSSLFLDSCSFEEASVCGMIQRSEVSSQWRRVRSAAEGPDSDYTVNGRCEGGGFFMHFTADHARSAVLESRLLYPRHRSQCLQFYLYNSGGAAYQLRVWVQEYEKDGSTGPRRHLQTISGGPQHSWELLHVTLSASRKFRVQFEGVRGEGPSSGGLSLDDVNLSETQCPHHTWHIRNFTHLLDTTPPGTRIYSPRFVSREGYAFQVGLYVNGHEDSPDNMAVYFHLTSGPNDDQLKWPCPWRQATIALMDQNPDIRKRMTNQRMFTTDPSKTTTDDAGQVEYFWDNPKKVGSLVTGPDGTRYYRGPGTGTSAFLTHGRLKSRDFIKANGAIFLLTLEDLSSLVPAAVVRDDGHQVRSASEGTAGGGSAATMAAGVFVAAVMLLVAVATAFYYGKKNRKREREAEQGTELENK
uniref:Metalloendopeptidase n=1 Tax=Denticeps clupeoides TaxID=299321 RepID=A0AAY4CPM6_9TELE